MKTLKTLCALLGMMFFYNLPTFALTVMPMDLRDLTAQAGMIFIGTVTDIRSEKDSNTIYTYVTFSDLRVVKGIYLDETIKVRLSGGTVAGETLHIPGMPKFVVGDKDIIFLAGNFRYFCPVVGWGQGRFKIRWDENLRQEVVFDNSNVSVKGIKGNKIIRASTVMSPQNASPGVPDTGEISAPKAEELEAQRLDKKLSLKNFITVIEREMGVRQ